MPLTERTIVDLREEMARRALDERYTVTEVAEMFGVSRPTVRLWRDRYREMGRAGLIDQSHAPHVIPHRTAEDIEHLIVKERERWGFGSKKILARLAEAHPTLVLPKRSTIDAILARHNLVSRRRSRRRPSSTPFVRRYEASKPGELMTADFKGHFRLGNRTYCYPLTLCDSFSRFLLACEALTSTRFDPAWQVIERIFREHGLPLAVQTDNGPPFGPTHGRYSLMAVRLMTLDIQPVFSRPGRPADNGRHERMHRDLKERTTRPPSHSRRQQQEQFNAFRHFYNEERPHEGIGMLRPARLYQPSPRRFPRRPPQPTYPGHVEVRRVTSSGLFKWRGEQVFLGDAFSGYDIGLEETGDAIWTIHFYNFTIAKLDETKNTIM